MTATPRAPVTGPSGLLDRAPDVSERIAARLLEHPDVAELHGGPYGTTATYLSGRRVVGVRVGTLEDGVEVAVVLHLRRPFREVAAELQQAVRGVLTTTAAVAVHVTVADVVTADSVPSRRRML